jgi:hypothetical protein
MNGRARYQIQAYFFTTACRYLQVRNVLFFMSQLHKAFNNFHDDTFSCYENRDESGKGVA